MGKLKGIIQLTGKFDGLSFYEMNGKIVVRKTGGFDGEKIKNNANYARVRENSSEFAHCAKVGKYFSGKRFFFFARKEKLILVELIARRC